ncbi:uncharacterized protein V1513DRAFT_487325 [Lipomyces chichibuensis]|uniref:uncharacterized protein n=1 Tax=Lipomyces chichibuensis TaxID=1546026 RepID=UPI003343E752
MGAKAQPSHTTQAVAPDRSCKDYEILIENSINSVRSTPGILTDLITQSTIFILSHHDMISTLDAFIDPANLPKKYGGKLDFEFGQMPVLDPALKNVLKWEGLHTHFPHGPIYWRDNGDHIVATAIGSVDHKERRETICTVRKTMPEYNLPSEKVNGDNLAALRSVEIES